MDCNLIPPRHERSAFVGFSSLKNLRKISGLVMMCEILSTILFIKPINFFG